MDDEPEYVEVMAKANIGPDDIEKINGEEEIQEHIYQRLAKELADQILQQAEAAIIEDRYVDPRGRTVQYGLRIQLVKPKNNTFEKKVPPKPKEKVPPKPKPGSLAVLPARSDSTVHGTAIPSSSLEYEIERLARERDEELRRASHMYPPVEARHRQEEIMIIYRRKLDEIMRGGYYHP